jgi:hypothetical protein
MNLLDLSNKNRQTTQRNIYIFDPHTYVDKEHELVIGDTVYNLRVLNLDEKVIGESWIFLMDSFSTSNLAFFYPRNLRVAILKESPIHTRLLDEKVLAKRFKLVLTHREDLIEKGNPFRRVDFSTNWALCDMTVKNMTKTELISFIGNLEHPQEHGYIFRHEIAKRLTERKNIHLYGKGIKFIKFKSEGLVPYCFSIALENCRENFYYTEKIIDCFFCDTVPIYWGCPKIGDIFDDRGLIAFETLDELLKIIDGLSFQKYQEMLPYVRENKRRCIELGLDNYDDYLARCIIEVDKFFKYPEKPLKNWQSSKFMAGLRLFDERYLRVLSEKGK